MAEEEASNFIEVHTLRGALERIMALCRLPDKAFCTMVTQRQDCSTHTTKWAEISSQAARALRDSDTIRKRYKIDDVD